MKSTLLTFSLLLIFTLSAAAQIPVATHVQILKAEDSRTYDAVLEGLLKSPNAAVRVRAALAAGRIGDKAAVPALARLLNDSSDKVREMAAFALGETESIEAADAVRIALTETARAQMPGQETANVKGRLLEAAGKIVAANAQDAKAKELGEIIKVFVIGETAKSEMKEGGPRTVQVTKGAATNTVDQRTETLLLGLTALLRARPTGTDEVAARLLKHPDGRVRADAGNTLARVRAKNANAALKDIVLFDKDDNARVNAIRALAAAEDKDAVNLLIETATNDKNVAIRIAGQRALATLRDPKSGDALLTHAEKLFAQYKAAVKPNVVPSESSEFIEVMTALGRILQFTKNERAINLVREFAKVDKGMTAEVYVARVRINPVRGQGTAPEMTHWQQYRTMALVANEVASLEMPDDESKAYKAGGVDPMRQLAKAYAEVDPAVEGDRMLAAPDALQAFARYKTDDLGEVARLSLLNKDVFLRTTAAGILGDLPASKENVDALKSAFTKSLLTDKKENDAQLAMLDAMFKLDKKESVGTLMVALSSPDYLVRKSALDKLSNPDLAKDFPGVPTSVELARKNKKDKVLPYTPAFGTKLGQVLNTDVDYRRVASRKNGTISAVFTTAKGTFTIQFLPEEAPLTVDNFVKLARTGYFNGLEVHRVVPNFVVQDGDPIGNGSGGPGWSIRCEMNMVAFERGVVGMALSGKDTGGSQWFVTHSPQPHLDGGYTVFGRVNETGMKVVDKIVRGDKILSVRIVGR